MEKQKYVAYLRQSTKKQQNSGLGVEAQREIIQKYLKDTIPISEYIETESGKKSDRPKLSEALGECRKTGATLIVAKLDRLSRNVAFTSKLLESDVEIVFCDFPKANKLVLHIISSIAEYEAGVSVSAILSCRPFFILIFLPYIKMRHYGFSRKSIWKNLETFP